MESTETTPRRPWVHVDILLDTVAAAPVRPHGDCERLRLLKMMAATCRENYVVFSPLLFKELVKYHAISMFIASNAGQEAVVDKLIQAGASPNQFVSFDGDPLSRPRNLSEVSKHLKATLFLHDGPQLAYSSLLSPYSIWSPYHEIGVVSSPQHAELTSI
jgi:hypothetical protein